MDEFDKEFDVSGELDEIPLESAEVERNRAKAWMNTAAQGFRNTDFWRGQARALWCLLDDIDTLDDACRENDAAFRDFTRSRQQRRCQLTMNMDDEAVDEGRAVLQAALINKTAEIKATLENEQKSRK